jgi:hypothetical protein
MARLGIQRYKPLAESRADNLSTRSAQVVPIVFVASAAGNYFFREIADYLADSLSLLGRPAYSLALSDIDGLPLNACNVIVAPHEFTWFCGLSGREYIFAERNCSMLITEHPNGPYWPMCLRAARFAGAVFDLDPISVARLRSKNIDARLLLLGYNPKYDLSRKGLPRIRDVFFAGDTQVGQRSELIAQICKRLPPERAWIHVQDKSAPVHKSENTNFIFGIERARQIAQSRIGLDLSWASEPYLDQFRYFQQYATNGALIFTNREGPLDCLQPGVDFISARTSEYVDSLFTLLAQPEHIEQIATRAHEKFIALRSIQDTLGWLTTFPLPQTPSHPSVFAFKAYPLAAWAWRSKSGAWIGKAMVRGALRRVWHRVRDCWLKVTTPQG